MDSIVHDLRTTLRSLRRSPAFTAAVVITLALGIGANTAIFSVVNGVILRPLPYASPDRLVMIWEENPSMDYGVRYIPTSPGNFTDFRADTNVFSDAGAFRYRSSTVGGEGDAEQLWGAELTPSMFSTLGIRPFVGRAFASDEEGPGKPGTVLLSYGLWQRRFGGNASVIGTTVNVDGAKRTVIGVMPEWFRFPLPSMYPILTKVRAEFWIPHLIDPSNPIRGGRYMGVIARLRDGVSVAQARAALTMTSRQLAERFPNNNAGWSATAIPIAEHVAAPVRPALLILLGAVGLVLLIACANVANLQLARATRRQREVLVRAALGAGRGRIVRQALTESLVLAALGGVAGLVIVVWGTDALRAMLPAGFPRVAEVAVDVRVLMFATVVSLGTGLVFGIVPAMRSSRVDLARALNEGGRRAIGDRRSRRARSALVVAQVALAMVLLVAAGLLTRSVARLLAVNPGFDVSGLLTAGVRPPARDFPSEAARRQAYTAMIERAATLPGVTGVSASSLVPFSELEDFFGVTIEGRPVVKDGQNPEARFYVVVPGYFETLRVPVRQGRSLTRGDDERAPKVAVINRRFAELYFANANPIGRRVMSGSEEYRTIVGVVENVSYSGLDATPKAEMFVPYTQQNADDMTLILRTAGDPSALAAPLRTAVREAARGVPLAEIATMDALVAASVAQRRLSMTLLGTFAVLALLLASVGIYGVLSYAVAERSREIGIRRALGAQDGQVVGMVVGEGMRLAVVGVVAGVVGALLATRLLRGLLYGVGATDPATFVVVTVLVAGVAFAASYLPARRAARVDPTEALRAE
ncbi:MAG TPA: ABC transporter permease [Gemmatimonadaceae bacterium]|nr:ABC transporter permease [Gemmatimonadaceae bacterium]